MSQGDLIAKGKLEGKLQLLEVLIEARGFHLDAEIRQRLADADELDAIAARAVSIEALDELFEG